MIVFTARSCDPKFAQCEISNLFQLIRCTRRAIITTANCLCTIMHRSFFPLLKKRSGNRRCGSGRKPCCNHLRYLPTTHFFEQTLSKVVNDNARFGLLRDKYLSSDRAVQNAVSTLNIPVDEPTQSRAEQAEAKTYYYFFFSRPLIDGGSSQNRVIKHTEISQITCTREELSKMAKPIFEKIHNECENEGGCTSDFNTYESMEKAQMALKRWLDRFNKEGKLVVKILKP